MEYRWSERRDLDYNAATGSETRNNDEKLVVDFVGRHENAYPSGLRKNRVLVR